MPDSPAFTNSNGTPINYPHASQWVPFPTGPRLSGPLLLQDFHLIDSLTHVTRERIPERIVHAKGAGAHGYFKVTTDYASTITSQAIFQKSNMNVEIPVTARFSTIAGEQGSADTVRDIHGFAVKLNTDQGIWDWVFLNAPVFFISDPAKFPDTVHVFKRNPQTNLTDPDMLWDFFSQNPESIYAFMLLFSDRGTPNGFHRQNGYSGTTFVWAKENGEYTYVKMHLKLADGKKIENLSSAEATKLAGTDPDYGIRLLFNDIKAGNFPKWDFSIQVMKPAEARSSTWSYLSLDATKIWPEEYFPLHKIGELVLNRNPENFFDEIEQLAFAPGNMIPYIEASPDPLLQARVFIYPDAHRYRLGVNHRQLPCNASKVEVANHQRAGAASFISQKSRPNYQSASKSLKFVGPNNAIESQIRNAKRHEDFGGSAIRDLLLPSDFTDRDFAQSRTLWTKWSDSEKNTFVDNIAESLRAVTDDDIKLSQLLVFSVVDTQLSTRIANAIGLRFLAPSKPLPALIDRLKVIKKDILPDGPS